MKKIFTAFIAIALVFAPMGTIIFQDHTPTVDAKSYKSGKKGFNFNNNSGVNKNNSLFQNKKQDSSVNKSNTTTNNRGGGFASSGLIKGLMLGGLAGLLFGGLLGNMGILGSLLGLFINVLAIYIMFMIIHKIFTYFRNKKKEETNTWRN